MSDTNKTNTTELLDSVRDIHEPAPPASSSALVMGLLAVLIAVFLLAAIIAVFRRRKIVNRELQHELQRIETQPADTALQSLAILLRRTMHYMHGDTINQLENQPWLEALSNTFNTTYFTQGKGRIFGDALYKRTELTKSDTKTLCRDISRLIGKTRITKHHV